VKKKKKMKTKNKILALEIAIVLCSMLVVAMPAIAAEQDDYVLGIYGNANEDDTIDMRDVTYTKLVIFGKKPETELANAYYDDEVDVLDVVQTKLIILGRESELTFVDIDGETVTVHKPIERIIVSYYSIAEMIRTLGAKDKVVGVGDIVCKDHPKFFPDLAKLPGIGLESDPDIETILELEPDIVITLCRKWEPPEVWDDKLKGTGIDIVRVASWESDKIIAGIMKLAYILDEEENACEYVEWHKDYVDTIKERTSDIPEDKKPKVLLEASHHSYFPGVGTWTYGGGSPPEFSVELAGGKSIAHDYVGDLREVETEWVIYQNPDVIIGREYMQGYETDDASVMKAHYDSILGLPGFDQIRAVEEDRVYMMDSIILWGPTYLVGVTYFAKWFHPDLFDDFDPQAVHQEYIDRFQGIDFDVSEHGVFVYPPLD
jgi:iron complex transport system substrate-binding protein